MLIFTWGIEYWQNTLQDTDCLQPFIRGDQYLDFIITDAENTTWHKCSVQNGRNMFSAIEENDEICVLIRSQNSFHASFTGLKSATPTAVLEIKCSDITQCEDRLTQYFLADF